MVLDQTPEAWRIFNPDQDLAHYQLVAATASASKEIAVVAWGPRFQLGDTVSLRVQSVRPCSSERLSPLPVTNATCSSELGNQVSSGLPARLAARDPGWLRGSGGPGLVVSHHATSRLLLRFGFGPSAYQARYWQ